MPTKPAKKKTTGTKTNTRDLFGPPAPHAPLDLSGIAEAIRHIGDAVIGRIDFDGLTSNVKNLAHLRTIADALMAQVIAQHGTDDDRKQVVHRLKERFFS